MNKTTNQTDITTTNLETKNLLEQGQKLQNQGDFEQAIACYMQALVSQPQNPKLHYKIGECFAKQKQFSRSESSFLKSIELNPNSSLAYHSLGDVKFQQQQWDEAINLYQVALEHNNFFAWSHYNLGRALNHLGRTEEAIKSYQQAVQLDSNLESCYLSLIDICDENIAPQQIAQYYQKLGEINLSKKQLHLAAQFYEKAVQLDPNLAEVHYNLGLILQQQGNIQQAFKQYLKAIAINPHLSTVYLTLRNTPVDQKSLNQAVDLYRRLIEKQSSIPLLYINLADALTKQNRIPESTQAYKKAVYEQTKIHYPDLVVDNRQATTLSKPNFMIIGAEKCGTSSLFVYLTKHPQVVPPIEKEIYYFSHRYEYGHDWYLAHFPVLNDSKQFITGEASTSYFHTCHLETHQRMHQLIPDAKLILILRDPVDRAISQYHQRVRLGQERRSLEAAISSELNILKTVDDPLKVADEYWQNESGYLWVSLYYHYLQQWMTLYSPEQFLVLSLNELNQMPEMTMNRVYNFLEISEQKLQNYPKYNSGSYPNTEIQTRSLLSQFFAPHNQNLEDFLGVKFNW